MHLAASIYEADKVREITRLTGGEDTVRYLQFAVAPVAILILLVFLLRRAA